MREKAFGEDRYLFGYILDEMKTQEMCEKSIR